MGRWIVNGVDLGTLATNVVNRDAGFRIPAKRGSNLEVPGRDGAVFTPHKVFAQGHVPMRMWALGCMPDGSFPTQKTRALICRENLERLFSLFTETAGMSEVIRVESKGYGVINRFRNPSMRATTPGAVGYRNHILNPAQNAVVLQEQVRNLVTDPSVQTTSGRVVYAQNLFPDPRFNLYRDPVGAPVDYNYWGHTSFEEAHGFTEDSPSLVPWQAATGVAFTVRGITGGRGDMALVVSATGSLVANASLGGRKPAKFPGGGSPNFRWKMRRLQNTTSVRSVQARCTFTDTEGVVLSSSSWVTIPIGSGLTWTDAVLPNSVIGQAPDDTYAAELDLRTGQAWAIGEGVVLDAFQMSGYNSIAGDAAPFWDGDMLYADWNSTPGRSVSTWRLNQDPRWSPVTQNAYYAFAGSVPNDSEGNTFGFYAFDANPVGTQQFTMTCAPPIVGVPYTLKFTARALKITGSPTVELCSRNAGVLTSRGSVTVAGNAQGAELTGMTGDFTDYTGPTYTPVSGDSLVVRVTVPVRAYGEPILQFNRIAVTDYGFIASGDSTATVNTVFDWAGAPYDSATTINRNQSAQVTSKHALTYNIKSATLGTLPVVDVQCLTTGAATTVTLTDLPVTVSALANGFRFSAFCVGTADYGGTVPSAKAVVKAVNASNTVLATYTGSTVPLNMVDASRTGVFKTLSVSSATLPSTTAFLRASVELVNPTRNQIMDVTRFCLADRNKDVGFFDGDSINAGWTGVKDASPSVLKVLAPTSFTAGTGILTGDGKATVEGLGSSEISVEATCAGPITGMYRAGFEVSSTDDGDVYVQLLNGATVVGEAYAGTLYGQPNLALLEKMQTVVVSSGVSDRIRVVLRSTTTLAAGDQLRVGHVYVFEQPASLVPRFSGNQIRNSQFTQQSKGWTGAASVYRTTTGFGACLRTLGANIQSQSRVPATAGQSVWVYTKVECTKTVTVQLSWFNSSNASLGTTIINTSTAVDRVRVIQATGTAPANTAYCTVQVNISGWVSGDSLNVYKMYASAVVANRDTGGVYDPTEWVYFDGGSGFDFQGDPVHWVGSPNSSESVTGPSVPQQWFPSAAVAVTKPPFRPPGSVGNVLALPGYTAAVNPVPIPASEYTSYRIGYPGGTAVVGGGASIPATYTYPSYATGYPDPAVVYSPTASETLYAQTLPVERVGNYLSGEVGVARGDLSSVVVVRVIGCADSTGAAANVLFTETLTGFAKTVTWRDVACLEPYYFLEVQYTETLSVTGYAVIVDNVMMLDTDSPLGADYPPFFDGSSSSAGWLGSPDASPSMNYAGARRFFGEVVDAVDPETVAGGTRAEFDVDWVIPGSFWEDLGVSTTQVQTSDTSTEVSLEEFTGTTVRVTDAKITIRQVVGTGPATITLKDQKTGSWIKIATQMAVGDVLTVDAKRLRVTLTHAVATLSVSPTVTRGGAAQFGLTPYDIDTPPVLMVDTSIYSGTLEVTVSGRRKYAIA